jgi:hypothetical protein
MGNQNISQKPYPLTQNLKLDRKLGPNHRPIVLYEAGTATSPIYSHRDAFRDDHNSQNLC